MWTFICVREFCAFPKKSNSIFFFKRIHKQKWRRFNALTLSSVDWSAFFLCGTANFLTLYLNHITRFDWNRSHDIPFETLLTLCENKLIEQAFWRLLCALFLLPKWKCLFSEWKKSIFTTNFTDYNFNDNNCDVFIRWFTFIVLFSQTECRFKFNRIQARKKMIKNIMKFHLGKPQIVSVQFSTLTILIKLKSEFPS